MDPEYDRHFSLYGWERLYRKGLSPITEGVSGCEGFAHASNWYCTEKRKNLGIYMENGWLARRHHPIV